MDVAVRRPGSRLALQNQCFFGKPQATPSVARGFIGCLCLNWMLRFNVAVVTGMWLLVTGEFHVADAGGVALFVLDQHHAFPVRDTRTHPLLVIERTDAPTAFLFGQ